MKHGLYTMNEGPKSDRVRPPASECRFLNEQELARRWRVDVRTLQSHRQTGGFIPYHVLGGAVRYRKRDIYAYERANKRLSTSDMGPEQPET